MKKKKTGYPSVDKTHLKNLKHFERHPYIPNISISNAIDIMYSFKGSLPVFDCLDLRITHKEFKEDADTVSRAFVALGIKPGDIICISLPNLYQAIVAFKAANRIGAIATFLNPFASDAELLHYLDLYNSPILINYDKDEAYNERIIKESKLRHIITLDSERVNDRSFDSEGNSYDLEAKQINYHDLGRIAAKNKARFKTWFGGKQEALIIVVPSVKTDFRDFIVNDNSSICSYAATANACA